MWKAMEELVDLGLCQAIGVSNFNIDQMTRIQAIAKHPVVNNQVEINLYLSQVDLVDFCSKNRISVTGYSPMNNPRRYWKTEKDPPPLFEDEMIINIGKKYGKSPAHVMLRFQLQRGVAVVPKSFTPARIEANIDVFNFELSDEDMKTLHAYDRNWRSIGGGFCVECMESHPEFPW